ncbi:MAG: CoA-binding protein [Desulfobacterales bacterium]|nr:MAG: CoA-binding protein [Desulfobacterales bacterium]
MLTTSKAIDSIFKAKSIAVVGASADPLKFGYMTMSSLVKGGYEGRLYPVNPKAKEIMGLKAYASVSEVPDELDCVVIIVPAKFVAGILHEAAQKGAKGAIIQSAGFREAGRPDLEEEIFCTAQKLGLRLMGPNIQGVNYLPNKMCAMFFPVIDLKGPLAVVTQSGTVTTALGEWAADDGLGISAAVNLGNQVDICEADYIDYFAQDANTGAIAMYVESLKNGPRFLDSLGKAALQKPVAILKAGRTPVGAQSAASHTGAIAGRHPVFKAACRQFGAVIAEDLPTLYDQAKALATLAPPQGNRIVIISTSGGAATLASDEGETRGLRFPELPPALRAELENLNLPPLAHLNNPIDLVSLDAAHFQQVAQLVDRYAIADIILISFGDPVAGGDEVVKFLAATNRASLCVSYMGGGEEETRSRFSIHRAGIPVFPSPERAMRGIAAAVWKAEFCRRKGIT